MTGPELDPEQPTTCPRCGAAVRHDVPWCLQCYANLRPPVEPETPAGSTPAPGSARSADPGEIDAIAARMLAELSTTSRSLPSWWSRVPTTPAAKALWIGGGVAVVGLVIVLLLAVVGVFL
jgi:hypothetical protein